MKLQPNYSKTLMHAAAWLLSLVQCAVLVAGMVPCALVDYLWSPGPALWVRLRTYWADVRKAWRGDLSDDTWPEKPYDN